MTSAYNMWYALINVYEDNNQVETEVKYSRSEFGDEEEQNITPVVNVKKGFFPITVDETATMSKSKTIKLKQQATGSVSSKQTSEVFLNPLYDDDKYNCDVLNISLNNKVK
jgi:hypothetical protein